jgi:hypothetical protein
MVDNSDVYDARFYHAWVHYQGQFPPSFFPRCVSRLALSSSHPHAADAVGCEGSVVLFSNSETSCSGGPVGALCCSKNPTTSVNSGRSSGACVQQVRTTKDSDPRSIDEGLRPCSHIYFA